MTPRCDFALLGAPAGADEAAVRKAFLEAVKAARPDREGGDAERYRLVIAAYRRLSQPASHDDLDLHIELSVAADKARDGGATLVRLPTGRTVRVTLPAALRTGRTLRLRHQGLNAPGRWGDVYLKVVVAEATGTGEQAVQIARPDADTLRRRFAEAWAA